MKGQYIKYIKPKYDVDPAFRAKYARRTKKWLDKVKHTEAYKAKMRAKAAAYYEKNKEKCRAVRREYARSRRGITTYELNHLI